MEKFKVGNNDATFDRYIAYDPVALFEIKYLSKGARMILDVILCSRSDTVSTNDVGFSGINALCILFYEKIYPKNTLRNIISELHRNSILRKVGKGRYMINRRLFPLIKGD